MCISTGTLFFFNASKNSRLFFEALKKNKVPVEMHIFPFGGHGFSLAIGDDHLSQLTDLCINWIEWVGSGMKK
jgi:dipeptidyl aminopeptidase/acylaminoacyl peptidase